MIEVNRTRLRVWEWGDPDAPAVICAHGAHDHGRMFDELAPAVADFGFRVVAPDLRGHGDSGRLSSGHIWNTAGLDLGLLAQSLGPPVGLIGHSFGGGLVLFAAGVWPEAVRWVVNIDGLGPPPAALAEGDLVDQATSGFVALERVLSRPPRLFDSLAQMAARRSRSNPRLPQDWLDHLVLHGARQVEGGYTWKADPLMNVGMPGPFDIDHLEAEFARVQAPTLVLTGAEPDTWGDLDDEAIDHRVSLIPAAWRQVIAGAGHYVHIEQPAAVLAAIGEFLDEIGGRP